MSNAIRLVRLAPDHEGDHAVALRYGGQLAALINTDEGLPQAVRRAEGEPFISDSGFLTFTQSWCREKAAVSFAIVDGTDTAVGLISLSHINKVVGHARTGIFLSSRHAGRGIGAIAFSQLLSFARNQGGQPRRRRHPGSAICAACNMDFRWRSGPARRERRHRRRNPITY